MRRALLVLALVLAAGGAALGLACASAPASRSTSSASCADGGDRFTKLSLLENLHSAPHILILGSSRARPAIPATAEELTGGPAFNAGVRGGGAPDEYVFTRLLHQRFPAAKPVYLIFVDVGIATDAVNPDMADNPLARPFLGRDASSATSSCVNNHDYTADGGIAYPEASKADRERLVAAGVAKALPGIPADSKIPRHIAPNSTKYFQRLLQFMNRQGATPVIVLNPIYPTILAARKKYGFPELKAAKVYLAWLHQRRRFILVNGEDIRTWGGKASDFASFNHIDRTNMNRLLAYVVHHSHGVLLAKH
jgi:hypothetical protein